MPTARLDAIGQIAETYHKVPASVRLAAGDRLVGYWPPAVDDDLMIVVPVEPVLPDDEVVTFNVVERPGALTLAKVRKNSAINAARLSANQSTFAFAGQQIAVDPLSRGDIEAAHGAILMLQALPPGWPGGWKTVANTFVPITTVAQWAQFYGAMVATGTANFDRAQALKTNLQAAQTLAEVAAVPDW